MGSTDKFCLRWNDFETNISAAFKELRQDKDFFDVTLTVDDDPNHVLQAHKVILSACSPFFRNVLLRQNAAMGVAGFSHPHPLVYLRGVSYEDLKHIIDFMYYGEVNVAQDDLQAFLQVAEDLKVKGLTQADSNSSSAPSSSSLGNSSGPSREPSGVKREPPGENGGIAKKRSRPNPAVPVPGPSHQVPVHSIDDDVQDVGDTNVKTEHLAASDFEGTDFEAVEGEGGEGDYDYAQYGDESGDMTYAEGEDGQMLPGTSGGDESKGSDWKDFCTKLHSKRFLCNICGRSSCQGGDMKRHVMSKHLQNERFICQICEKAFNINKSLQAHYRSVHNLVMSTKEMKEFERQRVRLKHQALTRSSQ
ncbi:zinc finger and BTB domain-containing protein 14-like isoform X7 [Tigriopus californicus]|uniref:zinc finger and BTB domain-containing protein 14-like isoform X7 n=1 Tax=Tigriopus californicus TaxID=6832 RepID=UPI0027DA27FE|nr:zinc finger and BTB domain-containing protein 14-like isoform X7 [Tigriopus californicus]